jgi:hypothetical protein
MPIDYWSVVPGHPLTPGQIYEAFMSRLVPKRETKSAPVETVAGSR